MLEDSVLVMEKKGAPRQTSNVTKPAGTFERKNDPNSIVKHHGRYNKRRDNGSGRACQPDFSSRKPFPQKTRSALDKRPRQRGSFGDRQREEIAETGVVETDLSGRQGFSKNGNLNHLLNFSYAPRQNVVGSTRVHRAKRSRPVTHSKEHYLQANCQFVVKDSGDYAVQACDPDALVDWDLVEQVRIVSLGPMTCPICLHAPSAGKITRCGHVYCWACILHYLSFDDKCLRRCPICYNEVQQKDLRSVKVLEKQEHKVGDTITLQLMKRARDSTYAVPEALWEDREGRPQNMTDEINTEYAKILVASAAQIQTFVIEEERQALENLLASAEASEVCFIESALVQLSEREQTLLNKAEVDAEIAQIETMGFASGDSNGSKDKEYDRRGDEARARAAAAAPPVVSMPLPRNISFDGSKIRKAYADAFEDLEEAEEESIGSLDQSDHEDDSESTHSVISSSSPLPDFDLSSPVPIPGAQFAPLSEDEPLSVPSDEGLAFLPSEFVAGAGLTTEEIAEQLAEPKHCEGATAKEETAAGNGATGVSDDTYLRRSANQSKRFFYFYQATDGQQIYLHSINARCISHEFGSLEHGPQTITAKIVDKEITFMKKSLRERVRYLSHLPLTCEFQVVEVELQPPTVSKETLHHFAGELRKRALHRQKVKREDRRQARKQRIEEKMTYGIYPEVKLALDNPDQFPAPASDGDERRRVSSVSDTASLASPVNPCPLELNANAAEFIPAAAKADNSPPTSAQSAFSFAAALKKVKQPPPTAWGAQNAASTASTAAAVPTGPPLPRRVDSEESDNEDRVPVPQFKNSFSQAISLKMDTLLAKEGEQESGKGGKKKKKKKEKTLLFSTDMMRR